DNQRGCRSGQQIHSKLCVRSLISPGSQFAPFGRPLTNNQRRLLKKRPSLQPGQVWEKREFRAPGSASVLLRRPDNQLCACLAKLLKNSSASFFAEPRISR